MHSHSDSTPSPHYPDFNVSHEDMLHSMGIRPGKPVKDRLMRYIGQARAAVAEKARPVILTRIVDAPALIESTDHPRRLQRYLNGVESALLMAGTAGAEWEAVINSERDPMLSYIYSCASIALARKTLSHTAINWKISHSGTRLRSHLSPGNDGLPLGTQKILSQQLPFEAIGIQLDEESLVMTPMASVTAIFAIEKKPLLSSSSIPSETCPTTHCSGCPSVGCALRLYPRKSNAA